MLRERLEEGTQKPREPAQEEAEVVAGGGEHGIDAIAVAPLQIIAAHTVLGLGMTDDWFDGGSPPHLAANGFRDAPNLAADPDAELLFLIVAAITLVDMDAAGLNAGLLLQLGDHRPQRVAVERVAMQGFGVQHKLAAFGLPIDIARQPHQRMSKIDDLLKRRSQQITIVSRLRHRAPTLMTHHGIAQS